MSNGCVDKWVSLLPRLATSVATSNKMWLLTSRAAEASAMVCVSVGGAGVGKNDGGGEVEGERSGGQTVVVNKKREREGAC